MAKIRVGLAGCGFVAELHMYAYRRVYGVDVEVRAVAARGDHVVDFARRHQIPAAYRSFRDLIADGEIDVVDICTPPNLHTSMIVEAMQAGKHVICEKPFAGYFGRDGDQAPIGKHVPKALMYARVLEEMDSVRTAIANRQTLHVCRGLDLRAGADQDRGDPQSHQGQDPVHEGRREPLRLACRARRAMGDDRRRLADPDGMPSAFGGALSQANRGRRAGETINVASVTCDVGNVTACLRPDERALIKANPVDVEDWGMLTVTFSDGTKATVFSGDMILGGVRNLIETHTSGGSLFANITPNTHMMSYQTSEEKLAGVYITEKVDRKTGWQYVCLEEEWTRGYLQEIQDFMECVATGRQPLSGLALAFETIKVNYAGYWAAEEGRRVTL